MDKIQFYFRKITNSSLIWLLFFIIITAHYKLQSCTAFCLVNEDTVLLAKNLDWPVGDGFIMLNRKGEVKKSMVLQNGIPARWTSLYNSVTFNQPGKDLPLGGMNEAGLVIEELSYYPSRYPDPQDLSAINELEWTQYQLDNFATVQEVKENLGNPALSKYFIGLHYIVMDRSGAVLVVEFLEGEIAAYSGEELPYKAITNNSYSNSLKYLQNFEGYGGDLKIANRSGSQERFVRAVAGMDNVSEFSPEEAFDILDSARRPDTRWQIVYDPELMVINCKLNGNRQILLSFNEIDFLGSERIIYFYSNVEMDEELQFESYDAGTDFIFGAAYVDKLVLAGDLSSDLAGEIKKQLKNRR